MPGSSAGRPTRRTPPRCGRTGGRPRGTGGGAAREGSALLQGRMRCGKCGRMMQTGYSGKNGNSPRYVCARAKQLYGGQKGCQSIGGLRASSSGSWTRCSPCSSPPRWPRPAGRSPRPRGRTRSACARSSWPPSGPATRQTGPAASTTRSSRRTGSSPAPSNAPGRTSSPRSGRPSNDLIAQQARRPVAAHRRGTGLAGQRRRRRRGLCSTRPHDHRRERKQLLRAMLTEVAVTVDAAARTAELAIIWQGGARTELTMTMTKTGSGTSRPPAKTPSAWSAAWRCTTTTPRSPRSWPGSTGRPAPACR